MQLLDGPIRLNQIPTPDAVNFHKLPENIVNIENIVLFSSPGVVFFVGLKIQALLRTIFQTLFSEKQNTIYVDMHE